MKDNTYVTSGDSKADLFLCIETGKQYIPCENSLQEYQREKRCRKIKQGNFDNFDGLMVLFILGMRK